MQYLIKARLLTKKKEEKKESMLSIYYTITITTIIA